MFVHDFVAVDLPIDVVVRQFGVTCRPELVSAALLESWLVEAEAAEPSWTRRSLRTPAPSITVCFGPTRTRADAVIVPIRWSSSGDDWLPDVDADLELAAFGPNRSHLHLLGRFELPAGIDRWSEEASLLERLTVAVVRHALDLLSTRITASGHRGVGPVSTDRHTRCP